MFFKRKKAPAADRPEIVAEESATVANQPDIQPTDEISVESNAAAELETTDQQDTQKNVSSVQQGLNKSRQGFFTKIASLLSTNQLDEDAYDDLEDTLL